MAHLTDEQQELINNYLLTNTVTECKTDYGYNERTMKANTSRQGYGEAMTTALTPTYIYNEDEELEGVVWESIGWNKAMDSAKLYNMREELKKCPNFQARVKKLTAQLKRKARTLATKCSTKTLKQNGNRFARRDKPILPSKK